MPVLEGDSRNPLTYLVFDVMTADLLAELPFNGVTFSQRLNGIGSFSAKLNFLDPNVKKLSPGQILQPGRTAIFVDYLGQLLWGGMLWTNNYSRSAADAVPIGGQEWWSYFQYRIQAADYTNGRAGGGFWNTTQNPYDPMNIAAQVVEDAYLSPGSALGFAGTGNGFALNINLNNGSPTPSSNWVTASYPIVNLQTVDQIVTNLSKMGYGTGFDFNISQTYFPGPHNDGNYIAGITPQMELNFWYPRMGRIADADSVVVVTQSSQDYTYPQDGTGMANTVYGTGTGGGQIQASETNSQSITDGWPLIEQMVSYTNIASINQLAQAMTGDLEMQSYPITTPTVTIPMFGDPAPLQYNLGDDIRWIIEPDERFPSGLDLFWRIVGIDYMPKEDGLSTVKLTLNIPPASVAGQIPPT